MRVRDSAGCSGIVLPAPSANQQPALRAWATLSIRWRVVLSARRLRDAGNRPGQRLSGWSPGIDDGWRGVRSDRARCRASNSATSRDRAANRSGERASDPGADKRSWAGDAAPGDRDHPSCCNTARLSRRRRGARAAGGAAGGKPCGGRGGAGCAKAGHRDGAGRGGAAEQPAASRQHGAGGSGRLDGSAIAAPGACVGQAGPTPAGDGEAGVAQPRCLVCGARHVPWPPVRGHPTCASSQGSGRTSSPRTKGVRRSTASWSGHSQACRRPMPHWTRCSRRE